MKLHHFSRFFIVLVSVWALQSCTDENNDPEIPGGDRDKFTGSWLCRETFAGSPPTTFTIEIAKVGTEDTLIVSNFSNLGASSYVIWLVSGSSVSIPLQTVSQTQFIGSGLFSNDEINLNYTSDGDAVSAKCTK